MSVATADVEVMVFLLSYLLGFIFWITLPVAVWQFYEHLEELKIQVGDRKEPTRYNKTLHMISSPLCIMAALFWYLVKTINLEGTVIRFF